MSERVSRERVSRETVSHVKRARVSREERKEEEEREEREDERTYLPFLGRTALEISLNPSIIHILHTYFTVL